MPSSLHALKFQNNTEGKGETGHILRILQIRKLRLREVKEVPCVTQLVSIGDRNHTRPGLPTARSLM